MLEILYRIYEVATEDEAQKNLESDRSFYLYSSSSKAYNNELLMDCMICDSREQFKNIIRDTYGKDIPFAYSKKLKPKSLYCIIIGEHAYDCERYFNKVEYKCDHCGAKITTYVHKPICFDNFDIKYKFFGIESYREKRFCSGKCKSDYMEKVRNILKPDDEQQFFIDKDMFINEQYAGYIYKITKKSTGEFYIGQTQYIPIFRWGQHLKTERFDAKNILDYQFETIEIVKKGDNILEREKYWIQKCYRESPDKSLNIMQTSECKKDDSYMKCDIFGLNEEKM